MTFYTVSHLGWVSANFFFLLNFFNFKFFFFFFLAVLGLCCYARAFFSCSERRLLIVAVRGLIAVASLVEEHGL